MAKETAKELHQKYWKLISFSEKIFNKDLKKLAKECSLMELNNTIELFDEFDLTSSIDKEEIDVHYEFLHRVKEEIQKL